MDPKLEFINHSSFLVSDGEVGLLCDFWKTGYAFNDGWQLLCETTFDYERFADVTHLWFSHEHPDHFSPADIRAIPEDLRARITVLFQHTEDHRIVRYCRSAGFKEVLELQPFQPVALSAGCRVTCAPFHAAWGDVDSWLLIEMGGRRILNINDCEVAGIGDAQSEHIRDVCGEIDLLAAQFSYAARQGNPSDTERFRKAHDAHLDYFAEKVNLFRPKYVLPFASFVYWCNEDNAYQNKAVVRVDEVAQQVTDRALAEPVVMYPGDVWIIGEARSNESALVRYHADYSRMDALTGPDLVRNDPVSVDELQSSADRLLTTLRQPAVAGKVKRYVAERHFDATEADGYDYVRRNLLKILRILKGTVLPVRLYVRDLSCSLELTLEGGLLPVSLQEGDCDLSINSQALQHCLGVPFGGETLQVNARFVENRTGGWEKLFAMTYLARRLEQNLPIPTPLLPGLVRRFNLAQRYRPQLPADVSREEAGHI